MLAALMADIERDLCKKPNVIQFLKYMLFKRGFQAVLLYRIRHKLNSSFLLSKLNIFLDWFSFLLTACDISSKAVIGQGFYLPHAVGIVIGSGCIIGNQVTVYQNVTLGRRDVKMSEYPVIGCNTVICCGSAVLGSVTVGRDCLIAANSVVLKDIQDNSVVVGAPGKVVK
jgi:serine O-acetyltransferase